MTRDDIRNALIRVARQIDPITIRVIIGTASMVWAIAMLAGPQTFNRPGWVFLSMVSPEGVWALMFLLHFFGTVWRFVDPISRPLWALIVNCYGFAIWFFATLATNLALGAFSPGSSMEWVVIAFQAFVILGTGAKKEVVTL